MCEAINIGNTQQKLRKRMDGHFFNLLRLLKNGQKPDSYPAHFEQHCNATTSRKYLCKFTTFKVVNHLNPIGAMKIYTKPKYNLCMEEGLTIHKNYVTNVSRL